MYRAAREVEYEEGRHTVTYIPNIKKNTDQAVGQYGAVRQTLNEIEKDRKRNKSERYTKKRDSSYRNRDRQIECDRSFKRKEKEIKRHGNRGRENRRKKDRDKVRERHRNKNQGGRKRNQDTTHIEQQTDENDLHGLEKDQ